MLIGILGLAIFVWWLTGSLWPVVPMMVGLYMVIESVLYGEIITDWHQPALSALLATATSLVPYLIRNAIRCRRDRALHGVTFRMG